MNNYGTHQSSRFFLPVLLATLKADVLLGKNEDEEKIYAPSISCQVSSYS